MGELDVVLKGKSLGDYTNTQLRMALGAVLYTNTADMWNTYLKSLGYTGSVSAMLEKYYIDYAIPTQFRNYITAGAAINNPQNLFTATDQGFVYDNNDYVNPASWRRNLLTYSEQFDNAAWTKVNAAVTSNATTAPDGTLSAARLTDDAVLGSHGIYYSTGIIDSSIYTRSIYVKKDTARYIGFGVAIGLSSDVNSWIFDFDNGQFVAIGTLGSGQDAEELPDGWWRISWGNGSDNSFRNRLSVFLMNGPIRTDSSYAGSGALSVFVWGSQYELGSTATTYQRITDFNSDFLAAYPNTTMFVDSAGTQPATVNGLVGLQLDKSQGASLGAQMVSNPNFATDTGWTKPDATITISDGKLRFTATPHAVASNATMGSATVVGRCYEVIVTIESVTQGSVRVIHGGNIVYQGISAAGTFRLLHFATGVGAFSLQAINTGLTVTAVIASVSVRELPGNHRYQTTTGSKPILRGTPVGSNLVTNGDFATADGWTLGSGFSISGGKLNRINSGATALASNNISLDAGKVIRVTYTIDSITGSCIVGVYGATNAVGATRTTAGTFTDYLTIPAGGTTVLRVNATTTTTAFVFDNIEIVDVSADAVTAPYGLQYDGIDDFLTTASVDFTATDKMAVVMGVRKLSDATVAIFLESSVNTDTNTGTFFLSAPSTTGQTRFGASSKGTTQRLAEALGFAAPITSVVTGEMDISGDIVRIRVNGTVSATTSTDQGTGNFGNYALYFGRRGGTTIPFNGLDFGGVCIGKTLTATQLANVEKWVAIRTGVTL